MLIQLWISGLHFLLSDVLVYQSIYSICGRLCVLGKCGLHAGVVSILFLHVSAFYLVWSTLGFSVVCVKSALQTHLDWYEYWTSLCAFLEKLTTRSHIAMKRRPAEGALDVGVALFCDLWSFPPWRAFCLLPTAAARWQSGSVEVNQKRVLPSSVGMSKPNLRPASRFFFFLMIICIFYIFSFCASCL